MVDSWYCLDRVIPQGMSQVGRRLKVGNYKRRTLNTRLCSGTSEHTGFLQLTIRQNDSFFSCFAATQLTRANYSRDAHKWCAVIRKHGNACPIRMALPQRTLDSKLIMFVGIVLCASACSRHAPGFKQWGKQTYYRPAKGQLMNEKKKILS